MISRLSPKSYRRVQKLYANLRYNLVVDSIIDGNTPAWIFVDDAVQPETGLMWNKQDALLLAARQDRLDIIPAVREVIFEQVIPEAKQRYIPELSLYFSPQNWEKKIDIILDGLRYQKAQRRYYTSVRAKFAWRQQMPPDCEMRSLDLMLLENNSIENIEHVRGWVRSFWTSWADFTGTGFGYCLLSNGVLASWCLSVYVSDNHYELGLATIPEYQNQGYATLVAAASVEHCEKNRLVAHWHCWEDNLASIVVAEKVGFERPMGYSVYKFIPV